MSTIMRGLCRLNFRRILPKYTRYEWIVANPSLAEQLGTENKFKSTCHNPSYKFHSATILFGTHDAEFAKAKESLGTLKEDPGNQTKLEIYALFKQATVGACNTPKPGMMDFVGKAKWEAWNKLGAISQDEAQKKYIDLVNSLLASDGGSSEEAQPQQNSSGYYEGLKVTVENNMCVLTLNRPAKKNALNREMYKAITAALSDAAKNNSVRLAVITGSGDYYCSGNDLSNFTSINPANMKEEAEKGGELLTEFISAFVNFPKPLVSLVNGPAIGVACTTLGLVDIVYATDRAMFHTPFSSLGQSPEGCSSYTFPRMMGAAKANELLLFNKKITAVEACERNLVTEVFPDHSFQKEAWDRVTKYAQLPPGSLSLSKQLIRQMEKEQLVRTNTAEVELLVQRWQSEECINAVMNFFSSKN